MLTSKVYFRNVVRNENKKSHFVQSPAENNSRQQNIIQFRQIPPF